MQRKCVQPGRVIRGCRRSYAARGRPATFGGGDCRAALAFSARPPLKATPSTGSATSVDARQHLSLQILESEDCYTWAGTVSSTDCVARSQDAKP